MVNIPKLEGIIPIKKFALTSRNRKFDNIPNDGGIVCENEFPIRFSFVRDESCPSDDGMVPVILIELKSMQSISPDGLQVIPGHKHGFELLTPTEGHFHS